MYGDHQWLLFFRILMTVLTLLSFLLFFIGLGTQTWFVATNGILSFSLSPIYFCETGKDCAAISWATFPTPPCGISGTSIEDRFRTVAGFTALGGILTVVVFALIVLTWCFMTKRQKLMDGIAVCAAASFSFGFIALALWGYTLANYQYCGSSYCTYMSMRGLAQPNCSESFGDSFNAIIVASVFMFAVLLLSILHSLLAPRLELEDPDVVAARMVPSKIIQAIQDREGGAPQPRTTTRAYYNENNENGRQGSRSPTTRERQRQRQNNNLTNDNDNGNNKSRTMMRQSYSDQPSYLISQTERGRSNQYALNQSRRGPTGNDGANNFSTSRGQSAYENRRNISNGPHNLYDEDENYYYDDNKNNNKPTSNKREAPPDVWRPPVGSDYQREPQTQLWWSARKPNEYVDGKTGHILDTDQNLWFDPVQNVWYEVEEDNGQQ